MFAPRPLFSRPSSLSMAEGLLLDSYGTDDSDIGKRVMCEVDRQLFSVAQSTACFGEILHGPEGIDKAMDNKHLDADKASIMYDLGAGIGRFIIYSFLQYPSIKKVVGVELAPSRAAIAIEAIRKLAQLLQKRDSHYSNIRIIEEDEAKLSSPILHSIYSPAIAKLPKVIQMECLYTKDQQPNNNKYGQNSTISRTLEFRWNDLFQIKDASQADIIILQTDFCKERYAELCDFLSSMKKGCRLLSYRHLSYMHLEAKKENRYQQLKTNDDNDRFKTSWSPHHRFYLYEKLL